MRRLRLLLFGAFLSAPITIIAAQLAPASISPNVIHTQAQEIAEKRFAVHDKGLQWLGMANTGEFGNPDRVDSVWVPRLEYPAGSGTVFLFSAGIWVGALKDGIPRVSTATDGDDGTNEFAGLEFATSADRANLSIGTIGWLEKSCDSVGQLDQTNARYEGRYLGLGVWKNDDDADWDCSSDIDRNGVPSPDFDGLPDIDDDDDGNVDEETLNGRDDDDDGYVDEDVGAVDESWVDENAALLSHLNDDPHRVVPGDANGDGDPAYDPEPYIDEDPSGDISHDYIDNDCDGLVDCADPDFDGDVVVDNLDDDGDGLEDEDDLAKARQEFITAYTDTCRMCVDHEDKDGHDPLGIRIIQHSYQRCEQHVDDYILFDFSFTNISSATLRETALAIFADFDITHNRFPDWWRSSDDLTYYIDSLWTAVGADGGANEAVTASHFGARILTLPRAGAQLVYKNLSRLTGVGDPCDDVEKYTLMASGERDPDRFVQSDWRFVVSLMPLGDLAPGDSYSFSMALINGVEQEDFIAHARQCKTVFDIGYVGGDTPAARFVSVSPDRAGTIVRWRSNAEFSSETILSRHDFQGYHIWRTQDGESWTLVATYDLPDTIGLNAGWPPPACEESGYDYEIHDSGLAIGASYAYSVTAFDDGDNGDGIHSVQWDNRNCSIGVLESPRYADPDFTIHTATSPRADGNVDSVYVVPNPYVGSSKLLGAPWTIEPETYARDRHVEFRKLPGNCTIQIFTLAGDLVQTIKHTNGESWEPWDLRGREGDEVSAGIYLYHVSSAGNEHIGKFIVVR